MTTGTTTQRAPSVASAQSAALATTDVTTTGYVKTRLRLRWVSTGLCAVILVVWASMSGRVCPYLPDPKGRG